MQNAGRILLVAFAASLGKMALLAVWVSGGDGLVDPNYWRLGEILLVWFFVFIVTAFGLSLLAAVMSFAIPRRVQGIAAKVAFVFAGGTVGWLMFAWTPEPMALTAAMGAVTAVLFAVLSPDAFRRGKTAHFKAAA